MRPIRLTMEAFGPYEKKTVIDFSELGERSFFLIHGTTGSGKTTVLDAICYAFYGSASAAGRDSSMLRSRQAGPESDTYVRFRFALGERIYEIFRNPDYTRQRKRGTGTAQAKNDAELWRLEGEEKRSLATGTKNVTQKMIELLGFASDEFRQVVLLPQGEFRRLLMADSAERQNIMERLFKTERFRRLEELLKSRARDSAARQQEISREREILLQDTGADSLMEFRQQTLQKQADLEKAQRIMEEKQAARDQAQQAEKEGQRIAGLFAAQKAARQELADCEARLEHVRQYQERLELADKAAALQDVSRQADHAAKEQKQKQDILEQARCQEKILQGRLEQAREVQEKEKALESRREELRGLLQRLNEYLVIADAVEKAKKQLQLRETEAEAAEKYAGQAVQKQAEIVERIEMLQRQEKQSAEKAARAGEFSLQLEKLEQQRSLQMQLQKDERLLTAAEAAAKQAAEACLQAQTDYAEKSRDLAGLQHLFSEGQAALLARELQPGEACPVCGATEHPLLAVSEAVIPDEARLKKAQQEQQAADKVRQQAEAAKALAETRRTEARSRVEAARQSLQGDILALPVLKTRIGALQASCREAQEAAALLQKTGAELAHLQQVKMQAEKAVQAAQQSLQSAQQAAAREKGALEQNRENLPQEYREPGFLPQVLQQTQEEAAVREKAWQQADAALHEAESRLAAQQAAAAAAKTAAEESSQKALQAAESFAARLEKAGFAAREDYAAALTGKFGTEDGREEVRHHLRSFEDRYTAARAALAKADKDTEGLVLPELEKLTRGLQDALEAWKESYAAGQSLQTDIAQRQQKEKRLQKLAEEEQGLIESYRTVGRLAEVANGTNAYNMHFQTYVLRSLLQDVIDAANARLLVMSRGQYRLQPKKDIADHRRSAGLDLDVFDEYTGYERPMATLSGGESFLASLSLALGLADVVTGYAGGTRLDTIFIDEGFGTLDSETLDLAIRALLDLQKGGRLVGIISHVEELKERIDARLEITKGKNGSKAEFVVD